MKHLGWIGLSGITWLVIGISLLYKGLKYFAFAPFDPQSIIHRFQGAFGSTEQAMVFLMGVSLFIGFIKGRFVLRRTVLRVSSRILSLPLPIRIKDVYSLSYVCLIGSMMGLGVVFRFVPLPLDVKGMIDVAVGAALIQGALFYFRLIYDSDCRAQSQ